MFKFLFKILKKRRQQTQPPLQIIPLVLPASRIIFYSAEGLISFKMDFMAPNRSVEVLRKFLQTDVGWTSQIIPQGCRLEHYCFTLGEPFLKEQYFIAFKPSSLDTIYQEFRHFSI